MAKVRLYIRQSWVNGKQTTTKTKSSSRSHRLHQYAVPVLHLIKRYHADLSTTARVFLDPNPWKYDSVPIKRFRKPTLKEANIPYLIKYTCRHTYALIIQIQGKDPTWITSTWGNKT